ncbi:MAG: 1,4-alpha-glucan branching enzyme, partial [Achromobacter sp.]|nr:1,4-alpha-glucan branching enzyme [Achromobacter sp.]
MNQDARTDSAGALDAATLAALAAGLHRDPFAVLGPHEGWLRVYAPGALGVAALDPGGVREPLREQAQGLYVGQVARARPGDGTSYRLAIQWPGAEQLTADPYAFGPLL